MTRQFKIWDICNKIAVPRSFKNRPWHCRRQCVYEIISWFPWFILRKVARFIEDILTKEVESNSTPINSSSRYVTQASRTMHFFTLFEEAISINSCIYTAFNIGRVKRISSIRAWQLPKLSHLCKSHSFSFLKLFMRRFWGPRYGFLTLLMEKNIIYYWFPSSLRYYTFTG